MRSDQAKRGPTRAPHRALLKAAGYTDWEIERPWIGLVNSYNALIPGHVHLNRLAAVGHRYEPAPLAGE